MGRLGIHIFQIVAFFLSSFVYASDLAIQEQQIHQNKLDFQKNNIISSKKLVGNFVSFDSFPRIDSDYTDCSTRPPTGYDDCGRITNSSLSFNKRCGTRSPSRNEQSSLSRILQPVQSSDVLDSSMTFSPKRLRHVQNSFGSQEFPDQPVVEFNFIDDAENIQTAPHSRKHSRENSLVDSQSSLDVPTAAQSFNSSILEKHFEPIKKITDVLVLKCNEKSGIKKVQNYKKCKKLYFSTPRNHTVEAIMSKFVKKNLQDK